MTSPETGEKPLSAELSAPKGQGAFTIDSWLARPRAAWLVKGAVVLAIALAGISFVFFHRTSGQGPSVVATLIKWTPLIAQGFALNLAISFLSMLIGTIAGVALGLARISLIPNVRRFSSVIVQFFRNAPWLALLFFCVYAIPHKVMIAGTSVIIPDWLKAVVGLALPVMANVAEIVRGSIQAVPSGQWQAASALGLNRKLTLRLVVLPQCIKPSIPPWMNWYAILTMATPLASIVGVSEAMQVVSEALVAEGRFELLIPMYLYLMLWFFIYCYPITQWSEVLERKYGVVQ